ncbi:hypothetical protein [Paraburkholderia ferrariae]|jgi:hypothetical protein|uniref:hypothetical protein n=1 Tax=Paraburkholderia ferrariae TaxID=386056 RepID=UPI0004875035|nr:hypothetical protein [Paraburkholderia ferrariae]
MNLQEQIGALEVGVDQLLQAATVRAPRNEAAPGAPAASIASIADQPAADHADAPGAAPAHEPAPQADETRVAATALAASAETDAATADADVAVADTPAASAAQTAQAEAAVDEPPATAAEPVLEISRPVQNAITVTIGGQTVALNPLQIGELIEQLSFARASMQPEPPQGLPPNWRFVSTKNPVMAVQKQGNGDRLLVLRHTGHGWVPFTFSPDMVVQMYMMLTQR